jgi:hypothetical protein
MNHCKCDELRAEVERLKSDQAIWAKKRLEQFNRIGRALDPIREKRDSGEPARDDATEIEALVAEVERLTKERDVGNASCDAWTDLDARRLAEVAKMTKERDEARAELTRKCRDMVFALGHDPDKTELGPLHLLGQERARFRAVLEELDKFLDHVAREGDSDLAKFTEINNRVRDELARGEGE